MRDLDVASVRELPTLPEVACKVMQLALRPEVSLEELAEAIRRDVAMSARILKVANSTYFSFARKVGNITEAVALLGLNMVRNLALSLSVFEAFRQNLDASSYGLLVRRSLNLGVAAETLASKLERIRAEDAFLVGLFQDLGLYVVARLAPEAFGECVVEAQKHGVPMDTALQGRLKADQSALGLALAERWGLPENIRLSLAHRARPDSEAVLRLDRQSRGHVLVAHLAWLASACFYDSGKSLHLQRFREACARFLPKVKGGGDGLLELVNERMVKMAECFQLDGVAPQRFSEILEEANAELGRINVRYELMYRELAAKAAELDLRNRELTDVTRQLDEKNRLLKDISMRDGLTGLYSHSHFREFLAQQVEQTRRYEKPLTLLLLDIDHFERINDTQGHLAGDDALRHLAQLMATTFRRSDIAARYGGQEFAVILVNTDLAGAILVAERLRKAVETSPLKRQGAADVAFTVSVGLAQLKATMTDASELIRGAAASLHEAKKAGRNRVSAQGAPAMESGRSA